MRGGKRDPLRERLRSLLDAAATKAVREDPSGEDMETIARLAKLIELREQARPKLRNRWPALALAGTLGMVSVLLFMHVGETEIELEVASTDLTFALEKEQAATGTLDLAALGVAGAQAVELPVPEAGSRAVSLARASQGGRQGSVTLAPLVLAAGAKVTIARSDVSNQYELLAHAPGLAVEAAVNGPVRVALSGKSARDQDFPSPKPVIWRGGSEETSLNLTFPAMPQPLLAPQLPVRELSYFRIDQFLAPDRTLVKRRSTILSGSLFFESLNGEERRLRGGEELQFAQSSGEIRTLELTADHIGLKFHGRVRGMTTGSGEGRRSLMPTYLEWLRARHGLTLLWATSLYVFGLIAGALRWWGIRM